MIKGAVSSRAHLICAYNKLKTTACSFQSLAISISNMAASSEGVRGGRRENSGRKRKYDGSILSQKRWNSQHKRIYLTLKMFEAWRGSKIDAGHESCSDSEFAAHLLSLEYRR